MKNKLFQIFFVLFLSQFTFQSQLYMFKLVQQGGKIYCQILSRGSIYDKSIVDRQGNQIDQVECGNCFQCTNQIAIKKHRGFAIGSYVLGQAREFVTSRKPKIESCVEQEHKNICYIEFK